MYTRQLIGYLSGCEVQALVGCAQGASNIWYKRCLGNSGRIQRVYYIHIYIIYIRYI